MQKQKNRYAKKNTKQGKASNLDRLKGKGAAQFHDRINYTKRLYTRLHKRYLENSMRHVSVSHPLPMWVRPCPMNKKKSVF